MVLFKDISKEDFAICYEFDSNTISLWSKKQWKSEFEKKKIMVSAIILLDEIIGICASQIVIDEVQINYFSIKQNFRRKGYGGKLMGFLLKRCKKLNLKKLSLEVSESNFAANQFYEHFNFVTVGKRKNYYRDGEDAFLKEKVL